MEHPVASVFDHHPAIQCIERDVDGAVKVNGFRLEELTSGLTNWQWKADAVFAAAQRDLDARGILCEGFELWRGGPRLIRK